MVIKMAIDCHNSLGPVGNVMPGKMAPHNDNEHETRHHQYDNDDDDDDLHPLPHLHPVPLSHSFTIMSLKSMKFVYKISSASVHCDRPVGNDYSCKICPTPRHRTGSGGTHYICVAVAEIGRPSVRNWPKGLVWPNYFNCTARSIHTVSFISLEEKFNLQNNLQPILPRQRQRWHRARTRKPEDAQGTLKDDEI